mgnify:CR=1 FL=1
MEMTYKRTDRELTVFVSGELDHHAARSVMESIDRLIDQNLPVRTTLDFNGLTFMDSSGIAVLLRAKRRLDELEGQFTVQGIPVQPRKVLDAAGVGRIIRLK